jgi:hypothetical protein
MASLWVLFASTSTSHSGRKIDGKFSGMKRSTKILIAAVAISLLLAVGKAMRNKPRVPPSVEAGMLGGAFMLETLRQSVRGRRL